jgi:hypothetical protein
MPHPFFGAKDVCYTRFERVFFDVILLKKRKKSFFWGKLLGARPVLVAIWRNFRGVFHARVGRLL